MTQQIFHLPDVGEGLTEAEVVSWRVAVGDRIEINQVVVEIETAKSLVELPSPFAGEVRDLFAEEGQTIEVGKPLLSVSGSTDEPVSDSGRPESAASSLEGSDAADGSGAVLVGYGTGGSHRSRRRRAGGERAIPPVAPVPAPAGLPVAAKPPIRKLAKDLNVDLSTVVGTGVNGEITRQDVTASAEQVSVFRNIVTPEWPEGREEHIPVKGVRKAIAGAMVESAFTAPHVTVFVDADATRTMEYVKRLKSSTDFAGVKVSPLLIMAKAIIWAVQRNPLINSSFDDEGITVHHYVNLGVAAATPRGLLVPNIKEAQSMTMLQLAQSLERLTITAREGKTPPADMQGGTITVTNIGVFGVDAGTPILNTGEVAIVALGSITQKPWVVDGEVRSRFVTTVSVSADHRVVDGDIISRFIADIASILEEPALLLD